jgi:hypothetical protein
MLLHPTIGTDVQHRPEPHSSLSTVPATPQATYVTTPKDCYKRPPARAGPRSSLLRSTCNTTGHTCYYTQQLVQTPFSTGRVAQLAPPQYLQHHRPHMLLHPTTGTNALHHGQGRAAHSSAAPATPQATHVTTPTNWYRCPPPQARPHS